MAEANPFDDAFRPKEEANPFDQPKADNSLHSYLKSIGQGLKNTITNYALAPGYAEGGQMGMEDVPNPAESDIALGGKGEPAVKTVPKEQSEHPFVENLATGAFDPLSWAGPGGLIGKAIGIVGSNIGGEAGKNLAKGSAYEIPAQLAGSLAGGHVAQAPPRMVAPGSNIPAERQALIDTLKNDPYGGVTSLTAGQKRGSTGLRYAESITGDAPLSGISAEKVNDAQKHELMANLLTRAGEKNVDPKTAAATEDVIAAAKERVGNKLDEVAKTLPITFGKEFGDKLVGIHQDAMNEGLNPDQINRIKRNIENIQDAFVTKSPGTGGRILTQREKDIIDLNEPMIAQLEKTLADPDIGRNYDAAGIAHLQRQLKGLKDFERNAGKTSGGLDRTIAEMRANAAAAPPTSLEDALQQSVNKMNATPADAGAPKGVMPGKSYQTLTHKGGALDALQHSTDPDLARYGNRIRDALDEAMWKSANARGTREGVGRRQAARDLVDARRQWRTLMIISNGVAGAGADAARGLMSPAQLRAQLTATPKDKLLYAAGGGMKGLSKFSKAANALMTPLPNSGTSQREQAREMINLATTLKGSEAPGAVGLGIGGAFGGIPGALAGAVAAPVATGLTGRLLHSPGAQKYLANEYPIQKYVADHRPGASPAWLSMLNVLRQNSGGNQ